MAKGTTMQNIVNLKRCKIVIEGPAGVLDTLQPAHPSDMPYVDRMDGHREVNSMPITAGLEVKHMPAPQAGVIYVVDDAIAALAPRADVFTVGPQQPGPEGTDAIHCWGLTASAYY